MNFKIVWKGNEHTNKSSRGKHVPFVIVNHISGGSMGSMDNWFTSAGNQVSSAHFGISKTGEIHQYVKIEDMAWHAGLKAETIKNATAKIIHEMKINPNLYSIGIEHEGYDGNLTPIQLEASIWLHKYVKKYIKDKYNKNIKLDKNNVIGHFQVDPVRKPYCPGPKFPWNKLYEEIAKDEVLKNPTTTTPKVESKPIINTPKVESKPIINAPKLESKPVVNKPATSPKTSAPQSKPKTTTTKKENKNTASSPKIETKPKKSVTAKPTTKPKETNVKNTKSTVSKETKAPTTKKNTTKNNTKK